MSYDFLSFDEFAKLYCDRQESNPVKLRDIFRRQRDNYNPEGWFIGECQVLDSSLIGSLTILPFGPNNTYKTIPGHPYSPRGLASDQSIAIAALSRREFDRFDKSVTA